MSKFFEIMQDARLFRETQETPPTADKPAAPDEFDLANQDKLPQEGMPTGIYRRYLGWLTGLPAPKNPRYKRWIIDMVMRWLEIDDLSTVPRNLGKSGFDEINPSTAVIR